MFARICIRRSGYLLCGLLTLPQEYPVGVELRYLSSYGALLQTCKRKLSRLMHFVDLLPPGPLGQCPLKMLWPLFE
jgi:hypothetical protein